MFNIDIERDSARSSSMKKRRREQQHKLREHVQADFLRESAPRRRSKMTAQSAANSYWRARESAIGKRGESSCSSDSNDTNSKKRAVTRGGDDDSDDSDEFQPV